MLWVAAYLPAAPVARRFSDRPLAGCESESHDGRVALARPCRTLAGVPAASGLAASCGSICVHARDAYYPSAVRAGRPVPPGVRFARNYFEAGDRPSSGSIRRVSTAPRERLHQCANLLWQARPRGLAESTPANPVTHRPRRGQAKLQPARSHLLFSNGSCGQAVGSVRTASLAGKSGHCRLMLK